MTQVLRVDPLDTVRVLGEDRAALLALLSGLDSPEWALETTCPGWSVADVCAHMWGTDLGVLARLRDGHLGSQAEGDAPSPTEFAAFIDQLNADWVHACRRMSSRQLMDELASTGEELVGFYESQDLRSLSEGVSWAGVDPAPLWLGCAREYTERWVHQQQIREAAERPGQKDPELLAPVLDAFKWAFPHSLSTVDVPDDIAVTIETTGNVVREWRLVRTGDDWEFSSAARPKASAWLRTDCDIAWRLLSNGLTAEQIDTSIERGGDEKLVAALLRTRSIVV